MNHCKIGSAKKLLSFLLCVAMLASMLAIPAYAVDDEGAEDKGANEETEEIYYSWYVYKYYPGLGKYSSVPSSLWTNTEGVRTYYHEAESEELTISLTDSQYETIIGDGTLEIDGETYQFVGWYVNMDGSNTSSGDALKVLKTEANMDKSKTIAVDDITDCYSYEGSDGATYCKVQVFPVYVKAETIYYCWYVYKYSPGLGKYYSVPSSIWTNEEGKVTYDHKADSKELTISLTEKQYNTVIGDGTLEIDGETYQFAGWYVNTDGSSTSSGEELKQLKTEANADKSLNITVDDITKCYSYVGSDGATYCMVQVFPAYVKEGADTYVLMNIPYADFYKAEGVEKVDAVSSATKAKTRTGSLAGGSYHVNSDGSDITGITFPVKVGEGVDLSEYKQITDESKVEITVTNRGQTSETVYKGKDALFEAPSYSYYVLDAPPSYYKELTVAEDGSLSFGAVVGSKTTLSDAKATLTTDTTYGDYQINLNDLPEKITNGTVYGVLLTTEDSEGNTTNYGLRHVENIWLKTKLAWSVGYTTVVHGCSVSYEPYESIMGQTIKQITYYTDAGIYTIDCNLELTPYYDGEVTAVAASSTVIDLYGLPSDIENAKAAVYYTEGEGRNSKKVYVTAEAGAEVTDGSVTLTTAMEADKDYTVYITSDNYAQITAEVQLTENVYALMNIPYDVFYGELKNDVEVDAVTSATTSKIARCANVYSSGATIAGGMDLNGVVVPVKMSQTQYNAIKGNVKDSSEAYYISGSASNPAVYLELTGYADGVYTFSKIQGTETTTENVEATITSNTVWGDYQVNLSDSNQGKAPATVYGVYFTTEDGAQYAMRQSENLWTPGNYYEFAWSTGVKTSDIHGGTLHPNHYRSMEGETITSITYITTEGIVTYNLASSLYVAPHHEGTITATATSANTLKLTGVPSDLENVTVTVATSGRGAVTLTDNAYISSNGVVTLDAGKTFAEGTTYNVVVSSSNFAAMTTTVTYTASTTPGNGGSGGSHSGSGSGSGSSATYTVSVDSTKNGTVSASVKSASKGTTVTVTVKPSSGYELDSLKVTDKDGDTVKLTRKSDTQYTFTMPASKVTVTASFAESAAPGLAFRDVASSAYYYDAVAWAVEQGITSGTTAATFSPNTSCTRAQTVTFLWRAAGSPAPKSSVNPFTDVAPGAYYYNAVLWAVEQGITTGTTATTFSPNNTVTRAQTVTFLYRAAGSPAAAGGNSFADVAADAYYASAVNWAVEKGITTGTTAAAFSPNTSCTRAQIVTFLYRAK